MALTAGHTRDDVAGLVEAIADVLPRVLAAEGSGPEQVQRAFRRQLDGRPVRLRPADAAPAPVLTPERHVTIDTVDRAEWNAMFAGRGSFDWDGLHVTEQAFAGPQAEPDNSWAFHYWIVRDGTRRPVAATFFTTALWKDDCSPTPRSQSSATAAPRPRTSTSATS